jgi:hypothetical protein
MVFARVQMHRQQSEVSAGMVTVARAYPDARTSWVIQPPSPAVSTVSGSPAGMVAPAMNACSTGSAWRDNGTRPVVKTATSSTRRKPSESADAAGTVAATASRMMAK